MSPRAKWIGAVVALVVLAGVGLVIRRRSDEEPISKPRDDAATIATTPTPTPRQTPTMTPHMQRPAPTLGSGSAQPSADMRNGITGERGLLATLPATWQLTKATSGHLAVNLGGGEAGMYRSEPLVPGTHAMRGRVIDRAGNPVSGAIVLVDPNASVRIWGGTVLAQTGATTIDDGSFAITDGPEHGFAIAMHASGGWSKITPIADEPLTLQLLGHGALHGKLRYNKHGESFALRLAPVDPALPEISYESDADGTFTIASIAPGAYKLHAGLAQSIAGGSSKYVERDVVIDPDRTTEVAIDQETGTTIAITAKPHGESMMEYWLFNGATPPPDLATAKTRGKAEHAPWYLLGGQDAPTDAEFHDVAPGSYSACAAADRDASFGCKSVVVLDGESVREVELTLVAVAKADAPR